MNNRIHVIDSKIKIPAVPATFLTRWDLFSKIDSEYKKLVIINAAAGFGKTILLSQYAVNSGKKCIWYYLDSIDNDFNVFMQYLCQAINRVVNGFSFNLTAYSSFDESSDQIRIMIYDFVDALSQSIGNDDIYIMFDDFHEIQNPSMYYLINILINSTPENIRFFIACRDMVPSFCIKHIINNSAAVITQEHLRFSLEETRETINHVTNRELLENEAENIYLQVEGWPVGVMFCCLYLERMGNKNESISVYQGSMAHDYLMFEVYRNLSYDLQVFLTRTSMLRSLSADLCNYIMNIDNSEHILQYLEQCNLFTLRIDSSGSAYRYHAIFRSFLQSLLSPQDKEEILEAEVRFLMFKNNFEQAVEYAIAGNNPRLMQMAFESVGQLMLEQNKLTTMERWIQYIKQCETDLTPNVMLICGTFYHRTGNLKAASENIDRALERFLTSMDEKGYIFASIQKARILRDEVSFEASCEVLDSLYSYCMSRKMHLKISYWCPVIEEKIYNYIFMSRFEEALELYNEAIVQARVSGLSEIESRLMSAYSAVLFYTGEYEKTLRIYNEYLSCQQNTTDGDLFSVKIYIAAIEFMQGNFDKARQLLYDDIETKINISKTENLWFAYLIQAGFYMFDSINPNFPKNVQDNNREVMENSFQLAEKYAVSCRKNTYMFNSVRQVYNAFSLFWEKEENFEKGFEDLSCNSFLSQLIYMLWAHLDFINGNYDRAEDMASKCIESSKQEHVYSAFSKAILAAIYLKTGDEGKVLAPLSDFLSFSAKNRIIYPFIIEKNFVSLMEFAETAGIEPEFIAGIKACINIPDSSIRVKCFGDFEVYLPGEKEPIKWRTKKARELFAYLIHLRGAGIEKEKLLALLWPDSSPEQSTDLLHTTLYNIRKAIGTNKFRDIVEYKNRKYVIETDQIKIDINAFEDLCGALSKKDAKALEAKKESMEVYSGPYMQNIDSDWIINQREYYQQMYIKLYQYFADSAIKANHYDEGISCLEKAVKADPFAENLHILLMKCYHDSGRRDRVHDQYNKLSRLLKKELDTVPSKETVWEYKQLMERV